MRIENDVLSVLSAAEVEGCALRLTGQLDRTLYVRTNKVLEAAGGKWSRKDQAHLFSKDAAERIDEIILSGEVDVPKDEYNYFPTPQAVVARMLDIASLEPHMRVLEPSAGRGAIASACADAGCEVDCYELMEANYFALASNARLRCTRNDFLQVEPAQIYDRVLMNPPFMKRADIKHVNHALRFLKPGGLLVSVMSGGIAFRQDRLTTDFVASVHASLGDIEELPDESFKESGTAVSTVLVTIPVR